MDRMDRMDLMSLIQWMWLKVARLKSLNGTSSGGAAARWPVWCMQSVAHELTQLQVRYPHVQAIRQRDVHSSRGHRSSFSFC
jgi:hypothetical protein